MLTFSTRGAAGKLGIDVATLSRYISDKKIPSPKTIKIGKMRLHSWTDKDIERVRALLPKIANGRKTRYQKKHSETSTQSAKTKKKPTQPRAAVPHKKTKTRKSKP